MRIMQAEDRHQADTTTSVIGSFFLLFCAKLQGDIGRTSDSEQQGNCCTCRRQWKGNVCRCISVDSNPLPDEDLVDNVIKGSYQHRNDAWNCEFDK